MIYMILGQCLFGLPTCSDKRNLLHAFDIYSIILIGGYVHQEQQKECHMSTICPPNWRVRASSGLEAV